jgi:hypothetical protein
VALELHPNDAAREAKPSLFIFSGPWVGCLVVGVMFFVVLFRILAVWDIDWFIALPVSLLPLAALTAFVHFFVNGRPPSWAIDALFLKVWQFKSWLYLRGCLDRPPLLWLENRTPAHPKEF